MGLEYECCALCHVFVRSSGPMRSLPPLAQPATMAAYAASLKDLTAINKLREEEREAARNRK